MVSKISTKELILRSFEELLQQKSFEKIRINEICSNCGVSRPTFYRYYKDKHELMDWVYISRMNKTKNENMDLSGWSNILKELIRFTSENKVYFTKLIKVQGQNSFESFMIDYGLQYSVESLKSIFPDGLPDQIYYSCRAYCIATTRLVLEWINDGMKMPKDQFYKCLCACLPVNLSKYVHFDDQQIQQNAR